MKIFDKVLRWMMALGIFAALGIWIEHKYGWTVVLKSWTKLTPLEMVTAVILMLLSYTFRTMRIFDHFRLFNKWRIAGGLKLVLMHNFMNNLLPMRTGELTFPVLMQRYYNEPLQRTIPALLWFRLLDMVILGVLFVAILGWRKIPFSLNLLMLIGLLLFPFYIFQFRKWIEKKNFSTTSRLVQLLVRLVRAMPQKASIYWRGWIWTFANWVLKVSTYAFLLAAFAAISFDVALLGSITGEMSSVLPIHGFAGSGTYEAGVLVALMPAGIAFDTALQAALNLHLFILAVSMASMLLALMLPLKRHTDKN